MFFIPRKWCANNQHFDQSATLLENRGRFYQYFLPFTDKFDSSHTSHDKVLAERVTSAKIFAEIICRCGFFLERKSVVNHHYFIAPFKLPGNCIGNGDDLR